ncbi:MAG: hypothetical protein WCD86_16405 [Ktedonobacteraceae bacterium]
MLQKQIQRPPHKMYAFERGWELTREISGEIMKWTQNSSAQLSQTQQHIQNNIAHKNGFVQMFGYIAIIFLVLCIIALYLLAFLVMLVWVTVHVSMLMALVSICAILIGLLNVYSWCYAHIIGIRYCCPHSYCYYEMPLPTFICPACFEYHSFLRPNTYGIFFQRCQCRKKLPTLDILGRKKLERICPACHVPLSEGIGLGPSIAIPIVGGQSAGKTTYIISAVNAFIQRYQKAPYHYAISFIDPGSQQLFEKNVHQLAAGRMLAKTPDIAPQAYMLKITKPETRIPKLLFIYDAAGEVFSTDSNMSAQLYYKYIHGIIFIIDPCALPAYRRMHQDEIEQVRSSLAPSELDVDLVYQHLLRIIETYHGVHSTKPHSLPIAVVVTKVDALGLEKEIGSLAVSDMLSTEQTLFSSSQNGTIHFLVRAFLRKYGLNNLTDELEWRFSSVRYFSCSAFGRSPDTSISGGFAPVRVLDPLAWLLEHEGILQTKFR